MFKTQDGKNYALTFALICTLFLLWGFSHAILDVLNKHFQNSLHLTRAKSGLVQFSVYISYFLMALPAGYFARRFGYKGGILIGLALFALGAFWFIPATQINTFWAFLTGLFIIAAGLTCLETVANPYTTVLGPPESGASRINLAQSFNAVGWILGPLVGGQIILSASGEVNRSNSSLAVPYVGLGIVVVLVAVLFLFVKIPDLHAAEEVKAVGAGGSTKPLIKRSHFVFAVVAQLFYVAAQTGINSFFVNYMVENFNHISAASVGWMPELIRAKIMYVKDTGIYAISERGAGSFLLGLGGMLFFWAGRISGSGILRIFKPASALTLYAVANVVLMFTVVLGLGWISAVALMACYFFMSIMFPTIFALGIYGLGEQTKKASSFIVMAIVGGAIAPMTMGAIADKLSMRVGFIIPLVCFIVIAVYAAMWKKLESRDAQAA
jgi:MFS transporter, FHS family, L-fucose permease